MHAVNSHNRDIAALLNAAAQRAGRFLEQLPSRSVAPSPAAIARLARLDGPLPEGPMDPTEVLRALDEYGSPATIASAGGRYFGFVIGGALPASLAANWLVSAWDQNAGLRATSPVAAAIEDIALRWLLELLRLPKDAAVAFVTGATVASFTALAAARHALLGRLGWDVERQGLWGAPRLRVLVSDEVHVSVLKALSLLGLGRDAHEVLPVDKQGRIREDLLPKLDDRTIICIQAGNVNTGAFDPARVICEAARNAGAWVHVDGAFGLWARGAPSLAALTDGLETADSWALDGHKWLNVPYDSGIAIVRSEPDHRAAMTCSAAYLGSSNGREPYHYTPELSRRARAVDVWAALKSLGRSGVADLIEQSCAQARVVAAGLRAAGFNVLNEVVLNQILVSFGEADVTHEIVTEIQHEGTCWCGATVWQGHTAMRISISGWATTNDDIERSLGAITSTAARILEERQKTTRRTVAG